MICRRSANRKLSGKEKHVYRRIHTWTEHRCVFLYKNQKRGQKLLLWTRVWWDLFLFSLTMTSWRWSSQRTAEPKPERDSGESAESGRWSSHCGAGSCCRTQKELKLRLNSQEIQSFYWTTSHPTLSLPENAHRSISGHLHVGFVHKDSLETGVGVTARQDLLVKLKDLVQERHWVFEQRQQLRQAEVCHLKTGKQKIITVSVNGWVELAIIWTSFTTVKCSSCVCCKWK